MSDMTLEQAVEIARVIARSLDPDGEHPDGGPRRLVRFLEDLDVQSDMLLDLFNKHTNVTGAAPMAPAVREPRGDGKPRMSQVAQQALEDALGFEPGECPIPRYNSCVPGAQYEWSGAIPRLFIRWIRATNEFYLVDDPNASEPDSQEYATLLIGAQKKAILRAFFLSLAGTDETRRVLQERAIAAEREADTWQARAGAEHARVEELEAALEAAGNLTLYLQEAAKVRDEAALQLTAGLGWDGDEQQVYEYCTYKGCECGGAHREECPTVLFPVDKPKLESERSRMQQWIGRAVAALVGALGTGPGGQEHFERVLKMITEDSGYAARPRDEKWLKEKQ